MGVSVLWRSVDQMGVFWVSVGVKWMRVVEFKCFMGGCGCLWVSVSGCR